MKNTQLKFRAWDVFNAEMVNPSDINGKPKDLSWFFSQIEEREKGGNKIHLMQFTGLMAEKCKTHLNPEIYEGDIFRHEKLHDKGQTTSYLVVMWIWQLAAFYMVPVEHYDVIIDNDVSKEEGFAWLFKKAKLRDFSIDLGLTKVGNVHENKELL